MSFLATRLIFFWLLFEIIPFVSGLKFQFYFYMETRDLNSPIVGNQSGFFFYLETFDPFLPCSVNRNGKTTCAEGDYRSALHVAHEVNLQGRGFQESYLWEKNAFKVFLCKREPFLYPRVYINWL